MVGAGLSQIEGVTQENNKGMVFGERGATERKHLDLKEKYDFRPRNPTDPILGKLPITSERDVIMHKINSGPVSLTRCM